MTCLGKPRNHKGGRVFCNGHEDAVENVHWGGNLCARHAKQVKRSSRRQRRRVGSTELKGQQTPPGTAS
jgi:hypothetical protein